MANTIEIGTTYTRQGEESGIVYTETIVVTKSGPKQTTGEMTVTWISPSEGREVSSVRSLKMQTTGLIERGVPTPFWSGGAHGDWTLVVAADDEVGTYDAIAAICGKDAADAERDGWLAEMSLAAIEQLAADAVVAKSAAIDLVPGDRYVFDGDVYTVTSIDVAADVMRLSCDDGRDDVIAVPSVVIWGVSTGTIVRLKRRAVSPSAPVWTIGSRYQIGCEVATVLSLDRIADLDGRVLAEVERLNPTATISRATTFVWIDEIQNLIDTGRAVRLAEGESPSAPVWASGSVLAGDSVRGAADADAAANRADAVATDDVPDGMFRSDRKIGDRFRLGDDPEIFTIDTLSAFGDAWATGDRGGEMIVDLRPLDRAIADGSAVLVP